MAMQIAALLELESELAVEIPGDRKVGNSEVKLVDRMNAEFTGPSRRS